MNEKGGDGPRDGGCPAAGLEPPPTKSRSAVGKYAHEVCRSLIGPSLSASSDVTFGGVSSAGADTGSGRLSSPTTSSSSAADMAGEDWYVGRGISCAGTG